MPNIGDVQEAAGALSTAKSVFNTIAGAGQGSTAAIALAGVSGLLVAAGGAIAYEVKEHKESEFLKEAHQVQALKQQFMPKGPDIFTFDGNDHLASARSIVLNAALRNDLATDKSQDDDSFLIKFKQVITESLKYDLEFFDARVKDGKKHETDPTASYLTWLMTIKNKHILNFEGCDQDLQYIDQLIEIMNGFISIPRDGVTGFFLGHDPKDRERFKMLVKSIQKLKEARKLLDEHKNSRTMKDFVSEMMSTSNKDFVPELSGLFIETILPVDEWDLIKSAQNDDLVNGNLRPEEIRHGFLSYFSKTKKPVAIPDTIFKDWLRRSLVAAKKGETSDKADYRYTDADLIQVKELFKICDNIFTRKAPQRQADGKLATDRFVPVGHDESCYVLYVNQLPIAFESDAFYLMKDNTGWSLFEINRDLQPIKVDIKDVPGLARILTPPHGKPLDLGMSKSDRETINQAITGYRNHKQLVSRVDGIALEALLHEMTVDLGISSQLLSDAIRDLGVIYMESPENCNFILGGYDAFAEAIKQRVNALLKALDVIEKEQAAAVDLMIGPQHHMEVNLRNKLVEIREKTTVFVDNIMARHNAHSASIGNPQAVAKVDPAEFDQDKYKKNPERYKAIKPLYTNMIKLTHKYGLVLSQPGHDMSAVTHEVMESKSETAPSSSLLPSTQPLSLGHAGSGPEAEHKEGILDHLLSTLHFKREPKKEEKKEEVDEDALSPKLPDFHENNQPESPKSSSISQPTGTGTQPQPQPAKDGQSKAAPSGSSPQVTVTQPQQPSLSLVPLTGLQPSGAADEDKNAASSSDSADDDANLESLLAQIQARITEITVQEKPDRQTRGAYKALYTSLASFESKSKTLMLESDQERHHKGLAVKDLGLDLAKDTLTYLKLNLTDRKAATVGFHDGIKEKMTSPQYAAMDEHKNLLTHVLRAVKQVLLCLCLGYGIYDAVKEGGFAITATRRIANRMQEGTMTLEKQFRAR